jgi:hypothetical protein
VSALATIGSTAPFVGLLGTVVASSTRSRVSRAARSGGIGAVSAGIAEALVETALGLVVAIPAVWFCNYLTGRVGIAQRGDGQLVVRACRLLHQEDGLKVLGFERFQGAYGSVLTVLEPFAPLEPLEPLA